MRHMSRVQWYVIVTYIAILGSSWFHAGPIFAVFSTIAGLLYCSWVAHSSGTLPIIRRAIEWFTIGIILNFAFSFLPTAWHPPELDTVVNLTITGFFILTAMIFANQINWSTIRRLPLLYVDGILLFGMTFVFGYTIILRYIPDIARSSIELVGMSSFALSFIAQLFFFFLLCTTGLHSTAHRLLIQSMLLFIFAIFGYYTFFIRDQLDIASWFFPLYPVSLYGLLQYYRKTHSPEASERWTISYLPYLSLLIVVGGISYVPIPSTIYWSSLIGLFSLFFVRQFFSERQNTRLLRELSLSENELLQRVNEKTERLELRKEEYRRLFLNHPYPIVRMDANGHEKAMNPIAEQYFPAGQLPDQLMEQIVPISWQGTPIEHQLMQLDDGRAFEVTVISIPREHDFYIILADRTHALTEERMLRSLGYQDALTGLPNRRYFEEVLSNELKQWQEGSLLFIDLDGFKHINDQFGHDAGDFVLQETARRLEADLQESEMAARLGGDEFIVFLHRNRAGTILYAESILKRLNEVFLYQAHTMHVTPSIGIARYPEDGTTTSLLLIRADEAMYTVKQADKNAYRFK